MYPSKAEFDSIWLRDKGAGRGVPHRYQPLWFWFWLWLLMLTGIEAWPFFPKSIGISFAFEEKRRFWRSAEASIAIRYPLFFLKLGCIDYCLWYDFPVVGRALWVGSLFSVIGLYVKVVTVCIAFVITQLEIRVYAGSEYIEGEGDKIPFAFLSEGLLDCYFAGDVNSSRRSQGGGRRQDTIIRIDGKVICG